MDRKKLIDILRVGLQSASPYNSQPWEFDFKDNRLIIIPIYLKKGFIGNFETAILYSLGTILQNLSEGARHYHYDMSYRLLTQEIAQNKPICEVIFTKNSSTENHDIASVLARYTNRKAYRKDLIPPAVLEQIRFIFHNGQRQVINVTNNHGFIKACSLIERVRIANTEFNEDLIENLCLTPKEAEKRRRGLDLRVLELPLHARLFLKAERYAWFRRTIGQSIFAQLNAEATKEYLLYNCPLLLALRSTDNSPEGMVHDWMDLQKILNLLQAQGLSTHLLASSPDLTKIKRDFYAPAEKKILDKADEDAEKAVGIKIQSILTLLRIGYADECEFKSLRKDPEDLLRPEIV